MSSIAQEKVIETLHPLCSIINEIVHLAWGDWQKSNYKGQWSNRGRANFLWEQMIAHSKQKLLTQQKIVIHEISGSCYFVVNQLVAFRFKKGDENLKSSNYPTAKALAYYDPEQQMSFPDITADIPRVDVVYQLNALETSIADVSIVSRLKERVEWHHSLIAKEQINLPTHHYETESENIQPNRPKRVRIAKSLLAAQRKSG